MLRTLFLVLLIAVSGCALNQSESPLRTQSLTTVETEQVESLLEKLYRSFSYDDGEEPDWDLMRSVFVDGAQFVTEPSAGETPRGQPVDAFISGWQASIRESTSPSFATDEWIIETRLEKVGRLIRADIVFQAKKQNDPAPRKPGLDSIVLVDANGTLKILSFVIHYESKL